MAEEMIVVHPETGELGSMPVEQFHRLVKETGMNPRAFVPSPEQFKQLEERSRWDNPTAQKWAATLGVLRGASFGATDIAARAAGVEAESLAKLREYNPQTTTLAELGGGFATGGAAVKGIMGAGGSIARQGLQSAGVGAVSGGLSAAGAEARGEIEEGEGFERAVRDILVGAGLGGALGAGIPAWRQLAPLGHAMRFARNPRQGMRSLIDTLRRQTGTNTARQVAKLPGSGRPDPEMAKLIKAAKKADTALKTKDWRAKK